MYINFYQYFSPHFDIKIFLDHCLDDIRFKCFCRWSGNAGICLPFSNEPFIIWKYSESMWTWYGDINIVPID